MILGGSYRGLLSVIVIEARISVQYGLRNKGFIASYSGLW